MANNRICLTCGKAYEYCGSCPSSLNLPVWKNLFDTENCKTVFETVSDYAQNVITKDVAKKKLSNCDTSINYKENIQKYLDELRQKYIKNPPEGMTPKLVRNMTNSDLLDMHYFLTEDNDLDDDEFEEGFYIDLF